MHSTNLKHELDMETDLFLQQNYGKKLVVVYGNCHTLALIYNLIQSDEFLKEYAVFPLLPIQEISDVQYFEGKIFGLCDVFIHQCIRVNNRYGKEYASQNLIQKLKPDCRIISIPNLYHIPMCFYPQFDDSYDYTTHRGIRMFYGDGILDRAYEDGLSEEEALVYYLSENVYPSYEFELQFEKFLSKVRQRENEWDIKMSDFILENYKKELLFYDPNHPTPIIIRRIANGCLSILGLSDLPADSDDQGMDACQLPLCGSVMKALSMDLKEYELRISGKKLLNKPMFLQDYISQYYAMQWQNTDLTLRQRGNSLCKYAVILLRKIIRKK